MAEATKIVIKQEYFDNIKVAIDALNQFFGSNFETKNFPMIDSNEQLDASILSILSWMNNVDPTCVNDTEKLNDVIDKINEMAEDTEGEDLLTKLTNENNTSALDSINMVIGHKMLQYIADHFDIFTELMNGIYTFEVFTTPSKYRKPIETFSKPIPMDEIADALGDNQYQVFNDEKYLHGVFDNPQITLPKTMKLETEKQRFENREDLQNVEIVVDDTVQEAAEINYFVEMKPEHLKYHSGLHVVQISKQFEAKVNKLVSDLRACNTTDDLVKYFENFPFSPDDFTHVVIPCILARVFASNKKFPNQSFDQSGLKKYTDSYKSILSQNAGANRFAKYDLFSTFKVDKEGTIKFIEDFLKLRLVNDESGAISNNTLLTLFNIFDSRIYLDIMYNMLPSDVRTTKAPSEDAFVKKVRAKINKNSRNMNVYKKDTPTPSDSEVKTSEQVVEYVTEAFHEAGALTTTDLKYCEHYMDLIHDEINTLGDALYNHGVSVNELEAYIGESYELFQEGLFSDIKNHFKNKKLKKIQAFAQSMGFVYSQEYIDLLTGSLKLRDYESTIDIQLYVLFKKLNRHTEKAIRQSAIDIKKYHTDKSVDISTLYPIGYLTFSQHLPAYETRVIASDPSGNVYVSADKSDIMKLVKVASSIKEFVRYIPQRQFEVESHEYTLTNHYHMNNAYYDVKVKIEAKQLFPVALVYETYYCKKNCCNFEWVLEDVIYPAMDRYFEKTFGMERQTETVYDSIGNPVVREIGGFDASKVFNCIERVLLPGDYKTAHYKFIFAFIFDKWQKPAISVEVIDDKVGKIETLSGMPSSNMFSNKLPSDLKSLKGLETSGKTESIEDTLDKETEKFDTENVQEFFVQENSPDIDGSIPDYMKTRIKLSDGEDEEESKPKTPVVTDVQLPPDIPSNAYDDLANSIDTRLDASGNLDNMLGKGFDGDISKTGGDGKVVYNITYNYNNSYNQTNSNNQTTSTNNDLSTGKHTVSNHHQNSHNTTTTSKRNTVNSNNVNNPRHRGSNNNNNSTVLSDTKDPNVDNTFKKNTFSTGKSIQEVFAFLESEEPLSDAMAANEPPKEDVLTKAMDKDRESLSKLQSAKKSLQKAGNTVRATVKPISRTKQWLTNMVNSLIKRDEDKVKQHMLENRSYRSAVFKAGRIALKLGLFATFTTINPWLGAMYAGAEGLKAVDRNRLRKEVQDEFATELKIMDEKIEQCKHELNYSYGGADPKKKQELYRLMRQRDKMQQMAPQSMKTYVKRAVDVY